MQDMHVSECFEVTYGFLCVSAKPGSDLLILLNYFYSCVYLGVSVVTLIENTYILYSFLNSNKNSSGFILLLSHFFHSYSPPKWGNLFYWGLTLLLPVPVAARSKA